MLAQLCCLQQRSFQPLHPAGRQQQQDFVQQQTDNKHQTQPSGMFEKCCHGRLWHQSIYLQSKQHTTGQQGDFKRPTTNGHSQQALQANNSFHQPMSSGQLPPSAQKQFR
jgi:hypothetical protein